MIPLIYSSYLNPSSSWKLRNIHDSGLNKENADRSRMFLPVLFDSVVDVIHPRQFADCGSRRGTWNADQEMIGKLPPSV